MHFLYSNNTNVLPSETLQIKNVWDQHFNTSKKASFIQVLDGFNSKKVTKDFLNYSKIRPEKSIELIKHEKFSSSDIDEFFSIMDQQPVEKYKRDIQKFIVGPVHFFGTKIVLKNE